MVAAGCRQDERVTVSRLASAFGLRLSTAPFYGGRALGGVMTRDGAQILWTTPGLQVVRRNLLQMRLLAEWYLRRSGKRACTASTQAPALAARLVAPTSAFARAWHAADATPLADRLVAMSLRFLAPTACVALRAGEVTSLPVAVVTGDKVTCRGAKMSATACAEVAAHHYRRGYLRIPSPDRSAHTIVVRVG